MTVFYSQSDSKGITASLLSQECHIARVAGNAEPPENTRKPCASIERVVVNGCRSCGKIGAVFDRSSPGYEVLSAARLDRERRQLSMKIVYIAFAIIIIFLVVAMFLWRGNKPRVR